MKRKETLWRFLLHYGISISVLAMTAGIAYLLQTMEIRNKTSVEIFYSEKNDTSYIAYVGKTIGFHWKIGKSVDIEIPGQEKLSFQILSVEEEVDFWKLELVATTDTLLVTHAFNGNTKLSAFIYTDRIRLWNLVFRRGKNLSCLILI